jgi:putative ABC transport system substrate-binding protein
MGVGMKRRNFIAGLVGTVSLRPFPGGAQRSQRNVPVVGIIWIGTASAQIPVRVRDAFLHGLRENGYVVGQSITIVDRYFGDASGPLGNAADDLVRLGVDVIVAMGTPAALAAKRATNSIPIVAASMADPVSDGLIESLARPRGNVTGNTFIAPELVPKRLQLLKETFPKVSRFAVLQHPLVYGERSMQQTLSETRETAREIGVDVQVFDASRPEDFDSAFEEMDKKRAEVLLFSSPMFYVNYRRIVDLAAQYRLPTMYYFREAVEGGGLMCYGADIPDLFRLTANHVTKILNGAKPGDLPVEQPTKFEFLVNLKAANALGVTIPPALLARADEVIE